MIGLVSLREKCPCSELFWPASSGIRTEYGEILGISPYSVRMRENADQNNSEYGHFYAVIYLLVVVGICRMLYKKLHENVSLQAIKLVEIAII